MQCRGVAVAVIRAGRQGRWSIGAPTDGLGLHELVRQFAHAQHSARVDVVRLVRRRYATFYAALLERQSATLDGPGELDAETALTAELGNLLNAAPIWLEEGAVETIAEPLLRVLLGRSLIPRSDRIRRSPAGLQSAPLRRRVR